MSDINDVERRIWDALEPYRAELEDATIYSMPSLRWPGAKGHDYFAAVKASATKVSLYAIGMDTWPESLAGASDEFLARRTGKATISFKDLDDHLAAELASFPARLYEPYRAHHSEQGSGLRPERAPRRRRSRGRQTQPT